MCRRIGMDYCKSDRDKMIAGRNEGAVPQQPRAPFMGICMGTEPVGFCD